MSNAQQIKRNITIFYPISGALLRYSAASDTPRTHQARAALHHLAAGHVSLDQVNQFDLALMDLNLPALSGATIVLASGVVATVNGVAVLAGPLDFLGGNMFLVENPIVQIDPHETEPGPHVHRDQKVSPTSAARGNVAQRHMAVDTEGLVPAAITTATVPPVTPSVLLPQGGSPAAPGQPGARDWAAHTELHAHRTGQQALYQHAHPCLAPLWRHITSQRIIASSVD